LGSSLFWDVTQRSLVVGYQRFGTNCRSYLQGLSGQRNLCNYQSTPPNISERRRSHLQSSRNQKSRTKFSVVLFQTWNLYSYL